MSNDKNRVWLVLYDLHLRQFLKREPKERLIEREMYQESDLLGGINRFKLFSRIYMEFKKKLNFKLEIVDIIWKNRVHLAASVSRLRIKNGALSLLELLPSHLQDDKVAVATANPIVTGFVNPFKLTYDLFYSFFTEI